MRRTRWMLLVVMVLPGTGCDTVKQDFAAFTEDLFPPSPGEAARMMVDPYDSDSRRRGTTLISNAPFGGAEPYLRNYRDMVQNERDPIALATAVRALGRHGLPEDAPPISVHLQHESAIVRWEAAKALQRIHEPAVIPDLLRALRRSEDNTDIHVALATALGQYPQDRVFQALITALDERSLAVNQAAADALTVLTGQDFALNARDWLTWYNGVQRSGGDPFAGRKDYLFPTFRRDLTIWDHLVFWSTPVFEYPAPPAGLRPVTQRTTYGEAEEDAGQPRQEAKPNDAGG